MTDANPPFEETMIFNGIDGASGGYLLPEMGAAQVSALAQGQSIDPEALKELKEKKKQLQTMFHAGVEADARDLAETGWGVIFAHDADPALREALQPLFNLRQSQAGGRFRIFGEADGYRPDESKNDFLDRHGMGPGPANPDKVPYYLLIVGDPTRIPYRFQYQLDVQYAVGRLHFDSVEDYARYAQSVVQAESGLALPPRATFIGIANPDDRATTMSAQHLVQPLAENVIAAQAKWIAAAPAANLPQWQVETVLKEQATKANLSSLLNSSQTSPLLFSASHGIGFPNGDPRQLPHQGALICQDWPGPQLWRQPIPQDFYLSAEDLSDSANLLGTVAFFFACYGAGTPRDDEFAHQIWRDQPERKTIAPHDFVASLPKRMLSLPRGGALAVVGHIERAWGVSFFWGNAGPQLQVFEDCFERLMKGNYPVGYALEVFNNRYAEISSDLSDQLREIRDFNKRPDDTKLAQMWTANNDARNYVIIGDPAVRLPLGPTAAAPTVRPAIPEIATPVPAPPSAPQAAAISAPPVAVSLPVAPPAEAVVAGGMDDYGLMDSLKQAQAGMGAALQQFVTKLGDFLGKALDEATSLEVSTYVSEDMSEVRYEGGKFSGARLRALTRMEIDGDTLICIPEEGGEVDTALWKIHMDMVQQAQANRAELLKTIVSAASGLVDLIKPGG